MASSDSEGFESADEGHGDVEKTTRKHRKSSSNYSDSVLETVPENTKTVPKCAQDSKTAESTDGWGDFDINEPEPCENLPEKSPLKDKTTGNTKESQGWDDFDDWGDEGGTQEPTSCLPEKLSAINMNKTTSSTNGQNNSTSNQTSSTNEQTGTSDQTNSTSGPTTGSSSWGWGWGVDSLLTTATAGLSSLTTQVSQGLNTVLESSIGAPDPEELARRPAPARSQEVKEDFASEAAVADEEGFPFGSILKLVGSTGTKVISGGLDTLETIGKKTMEILQDGDPGLARKRALIGLNERPVLSTLLREAAARAEQEDRVRDGKREAREVHYENLFDDFQGLIHLEALEMVSREASLRIEERLNGAEQTQRANIKETLQQVEELCEIPDDDDYDCDDHDEDTLLDQLIKATEDLGVKLQFQPLVKQHNDIITLLNDDNISPKAVYKHAITSLAQATALSMELYHKAAEMLLVKPRRSTADEADGLTQLTVVLTKHMRDLARIYTEKLNAMSKKDSEQNADVEKESEQNVDAKNVGERNADLAGDDVNGFVTNVFLEAENSCKYLQNALILELPIVQIGAV